MYSCELAVTYKGSTLYLIFYKGEGSCLLIVSAHSQYFTTDNDWGLDASACMLGGWLETSAYSFSLNCGRHDHKSLVSPPCFSVHLVTTLCSVDCYSAYFENRITSVASCHHCFSLGRFEQLHWILSFFICFILHIAYLSRNIVDYIAVSSH